MAVSKNFEDFTKDTTFHGVRYVFDGQCQIDEKVSMVNLRRRMCRL